MVNMSASKSARNQASIINRGNTCGGSKKSGLGYTGIGATKGNKLSIYSRTVNSVLNAKCNPMSIVIQTQKYGYRATI